MNKNYDKWNNLKKSLEFQDVKSLYFKERKIWYCSIGLNIGSEQNGHHENFERPVLIVKKINHHTFFGLPLTSKGEVGRYVYSYIDDKLFKIKLSQLRLWDSKRLLRKTSVISQFHFDNIKCMLRNLFK